MRGGAIAIWLSALGCSFSPSRVLVSEPLPEDVDYTAMAFEELGGHIFETTGLVKREPGEAIGVPLPRAIEDASAVHLFGFREEDLLALGFADGDTEMKISIAAPQQPILPPPIWYGTSRISDGKGTLERASDAPFVTAAWLSSCPELVPGRSRLVDSSCHPFYCDLTAEQSGCAVTISTEDPTCVPDEIAGRIDGLGRLLVPGCEPIEPSPGGASAALACRGFREFECKIEVHPVAAEPALFVQSVALFSDPAPPPENLSPIVVGGHLFGLEVFGDRIVVASDAGRPAWNAECPVAEAGLFHFLDPETLEIIGTATAPPCVRDLAKIPDREELFAVFGAEDARSLGRFAKDGRLLESAPIPERTGAPESPYGLVVHRLSDRVSIAMSGADGTQIHSFVRTPALAFEWSSPPMEDMANHQERDRNVIAILNRRRDELHNVDPTRPPADPSSPSFPTNTGMAIQFKEICENVGVRAERMLFLPGEGWLMGSRDGITGWIAQVSLGADYCDLVRWFEGPSEIFDFVLWPSDPNLVLAGVRRTDTGRAHLSLMNRTEHRFSTGSVEIGTGAIDDMRVDPRGRIYLLLPWSASVARAEMR